MRNKQILLSGRAVTTNASNVPADRYSFLNLSDAEPNLGVASANDYVLVYNTHANTSGNRLWSKSLITSYDHANSAYGSQNTTGVYANAAFLKANSAYGSQNTTGTYANAAYAQANSASLYANGAFVQANSAYGSQNTTGTYANAAFLKANSAYASQNVTGTYANNAYDQANSAASYANSAFLKANSAYGSQNTTGTYANAAYAQANSASLYANGAFIQANAAYNSQNVTGTYANNAYVRANNSLNANVGGTVTGNVTIVGDLVSNTLTTTGSGGNITGANAIFANYIFASNIDLHLLANASYAQANSASLYANGAFVQANAAYGSQNTTGTYANAAYAQANSASLYANGAFVQANAAYGSQNTTGVYANAAFLKSNSAYAQANSASLYANGAFVQSNSAYASQNVTGTYANNAYDQANSGSAYANTSFIQANAAFLKANSAYASQNVTGTYANNAYVRANNSLNANTGGVVTGNVTIQGELSITGNVYALGNNFFVDAGTLVTSDTLLILGIDNYTTDILDIGFSGHYNDGTNAHTGLIRDAGTKEWHLFKGYTQDVAANNNINVNDPSFVIDTLNANLHSGYVLVRGVEVGYYANAAFLQANTAYASQNVTGTYANSAYAQANSASLYANGAFVQSNAAYNSQNTTGVYANAAFLKANSAYASQNTTGIYANSAYESQNTTGVYANAAFLKANSAYESQNVTGTYANNAYAQANSASLYANGAFVYANSAYVRANNSLDANNGGSVTGTISVTGNVRADYVVANTGFASSAGASKLSLTDIGLVVIDVASQQYKFGGSGIESNPGIYGGTFGGNKLSLNNETNLRSERYDTVKIQTGTDGTTVNEWVFANNSLTAPGNITATGFVAGGINIAPYAIASYAQANSAALYANGAFIHANAAFDTVNSLSAIANTTNTTIVAVSDQANAAFIKANAAYASQNVTGTYANNAYSTANAAFIQANANFEFSNSTYIYANAGFVKTNTAYQHANSAYDSQNTTGIYANSAFNQTNLAFAHANSAFNAANNAIDGYVRPHANASYNTANAAFAKANAAVFTITANSYEIYTNTSTGNIQIGLANVNASIGTYGGATAIPVINVDGHGRVLSVSNTTISVPPGTYIFPNTNQLTTNANFGNVLIGLANVNSNIGTFGSEFAVPTITTDGYGRIIAISNTTISIPQGTYIVNSSLITSNSSTGNVVLGLAPSGVTAGTYGGNGQTPIVTVDVYGRVTLASNTAAAVNTLSTIIRNSYTATAAQTGFNTTSSFTPGYADVYVNGLKLSPADYTANPVGSITLINPTLIDGDVVDIQTATTFIVDANTKYEKVTFTATAGQTAFTTSYVPGSVNVYLNGLRLKETNDFVANNGSTVVLTVACELNDIVEIEKAGMMYTYLDNLYLATRYATTAVSNGQTTFTVTGGYKIGFVDVFLNGIKLNIPSDVVASDGSTIVIQTSVVETGDIIEVVGLGPEFTPANAVSIRGGTIYGSLNVWNNVSVNNSITTNTLFVTSNVVANAVNVATVYFNDGTQMITAASGSGTGITWKIISANTTANTTEGFLVNTTSANVYITLNSSPSLGNTARIVDMAGNFAINNCIIKGNGNKVMGSTDDLVISSNNAGIGLVYSNATYGWRIIENP